MHPYPALTRALAERHRKAPVSPAAAKRHADARQFPTGAIKPASNTDRGMVVQPSQMPPQPSHSFGAAPDGTPVQPIDLRFVHPGQDRLDPTFRAMLEGVSDSLGQDLTVTSGYRSPNHPVEARKPTGPGMHSTGRAADISMAGMDDARRTELINALRQAGAMRFGAYSGSPNMLHVDMKNQHGTGAPHFMFDKTAANMGNAPAYFQAVAGNMTGQTVPPNQYAAAPQQAAGLFSFGDLNGEPIEDTESEEPEEKTFGQALGDGLKDMAKGIGKRRVPRRSTPAPQNSFFSAQAVPWLAPTGRRQG